MSKCPIFRTRHSSYIIFVSATGWGCYASMESTLVNEPTALSAEDSLLIEEHNLIVSCVHKDTGLSPAESEFFTRGFRWARRSIQSEANIHVHVQRVEFNYCDFQPEILFFLSAGWLFQTVNNQELKFDWSYCKAANRYNFIFPDEQ